jgi:hypothetical protein
VSDNVSRIATVVVPQGQAYTGHIRNHTVIGEMKMKFVIDIRLGINRLTFSSRLLKNAITFNEPEITPAYIVYFQDMQSWIVTQGSIIGREDIGRVDEDNRVRL